MDFNVFDDDEEGRNVLFNDVLNTCYLWRRAWNGTIQIV